MMRKVIASCFSAWESHGSKYLFLRYYHENYDKMTVSRMCACVHAYARYKYNAILQTK